MFKNPFIPFHECHVNTPRRSTRSAQDSVQYFSFLIQTRTLHYTIVKKEIIS